MILLFLLLPTLTFLLFRVRWIRLIAVFNLLLKLKATNLSLFLMYLFLNTFSFLSDCLQKILLSPYPLHALSNHTPKQIKTAFYNYIYCASHICSDSFNRSVEFNYLKYLTFSGGGYISHIIDKDLKKKYETIFFFVILTPFLILSLFILPYLSKLMKIISSFHIKMNIGLQQSLETFFCL